MKNIGTNISGTDLSHLNSNSCEEMLSQALAQINQKFGDMVLLNVCVAVFLWAASVYYWQNKDERALMALNAAIISNLVIALWFLEIWLRGG